MAIMAEGIQPSILKWARERSGLTLSDVAVAMKKTVDEIKAWESGNSAPTYLQLEKLAYQIYKRPLAVFFFSEPPDEPELNKSFRTLPDFEIDKLSAHTRYLVRYGKAMQIALAELSDGRNQSERRIFFDIKLKVQSNIEKSASLVRKYLAVTLGDQVRWRSSDEALRVWRNHIEDAGIFIFKRSFKQKEVSGFCLLDDEFPIIVINNSDPKNRQIFTLFHELAHILLGVNGITKIDDRYIDALPNNERAIEVTCNKFAAEFLVPSSDFETRAGKVRVTDETLLELANFYTVSREVILRKFLDRSVVTDDYYKKKVRQWWEEYLKSKTDDESTGNYYSTQVAYLGNKYLSLVFRKLYQGQLTTDQVADYLSVKTKNVPGIEQAFTRQAVNE
jgi:Zn-dependent peptidase ImmA (M78 family)